MEYFLRYKSPKKRYFIIRPQWHDESGFSLVAALIGIGISGIVAATMMRIIDNTSKAKVGVSLDYDKIAAKRTILSRASCGESFDDNTCPRSGPVPLYDADKKIVIPSNGKGKKLGGWYYRAECNDENTGLIIRAARLTSTGTINSTAAADFLRNPVNRKRDSWSSPKSLVFGEGITLCPDQAGGGSIANQCFRKRSAAFRNDFVTWCPADFPDLYSCSQLDESGGNRPMLFTRCTRDGTCQAKAGQNGIQYDRSGLGANGQYYERVQKRESGRLIDGCWMYDNNHSHTPHRADVMCCKR